ncbi:hypothetical protein PHMEG_00031534 [Phytophthora megakarya]|uniref:Chromo domain-containing protein n=1 Tax=Phytophthora megakarya TaxID=4795 RepID=A0A225UYL9_9STRA|nr:hypothetical protein PHMEG_00031534 [Phytophthora megakarya]
MDWYSRFGIPRHWISDQATHRKNELMDKLCTRLKCKQTFSPTYSTWINGSVECVNRLKFFADRDLEITEEFLEQVAFQGIMLCVRKLIQHHWNNTSRCYEIQVGWHGLEAIEDSWEPLLALHKDVKTLVQAYVATAKDSKLERHLKALEAPTRRY